MKKRYIVLISFLAVLSIFIGIILGFLINGKCNYKYENTNEHLKNWMKMVKDDTKLNEIVIPGSHDSGSYKMFFPAETQKFDIEKQLLLGCRYFDIRITKEKDDLLIFHNIINGVKAEPIIKAFSDFLNENPSEVLIIDFQHFKNDSKDSVFDLIDKYLKDKAVKNDTNLSDLAFIDSLNLGDVRGKCIITVHHKVFSTKNYIFTRNSDTCIYSSRVLNSMYEKEYNTLPSLEFIEKGVPLYFENIKEKIENEGYKGLFVLQLQLTDGKKIFGPWSREKNHDANITSYISYLPHTENFKYLNIILRDFVNEAKCENIIKLNYDKENIKDEYDDIFISKFNI